MRDVGDLLTRPAAWVVTSQDEAYGLSETTTKRITVDERTANLLV